MFYKQEEEQQQQQKRRRTISKKWRSVLNVGGQSFELNLDWPCITIDNV